MSSSDRDAPRIAGIARIAGSDPVPNPPSAESPADGDPELDTRKLFAACRRRVIVHQGERYCLQLTRAGKLLLTK